MNLIKTEQFTLEVNEMYQAVGDNRESRKIIHLLGEVDVSGVKDCRPKPKKKFLFKKDFVIFKIKQLEISRRVAWHTAQNPEVGFKSRRRILD